MHRLFLGEISSRKTFFLTDRCLKHPLWMVFSSMPADLNQTLLNKSLLLLGELVVGDAITELRTLLKYLGHEELVCRYPEFGA